MEIRRLTSFPVALLALLLFAPVTVLANDYAGWHANANKLGMRGYIEQPDSGTVTGEAVASWIGLCGSSCSGVTYYGGGGSGAEWVQLGQYQGEAAPGTSTSVTSQYYENVDPCGVYFADDLTPPDNGRQWYSVRWTGDSASTFHCPNGTPFQGYTFQYKKGSSSNDPFFFGVMRTNDGRADANTEYVATPPQATTYFGCESPISCNNQNYGLDLQGQDGIWVRWQGAATSIGPADPPYRSTFNAYWSFKTCKTAAAC